MRWRGVEGGVGVWGCHAPASGPHEGQGEGVEGEGNSPSPEQVSGQLDVETPFVVESPQSTKSQSEAQPQGS